MATRKAIFTLLMCAAFVYGQTNRGSIRGTITDQSGAVVAGADVTVTNAATGVAASTKSTGAGTYNVSALPVGAYRIQVSLAGFKTLARDNLVVDIGGATGVDLMLEVGSTAETMTVEAAAPILKSEQSSTATQVSVQAFSELPLSAGGGRSPQNFKYLTPGVGRNNSVNGSPQFSGQVSMDGITVQNAEMLGADRNIRFPPEAVAEMSIVTSAYAAEYGQTAGGVQRYEVMSGTNEFHGNAYEYMKRTGLDARGFFNATRPLDNQDEYGFSLGGPVRIPKLYDGRNKSFFFFNTDWFRTEGGAFDRTFSYPIDDFRGGNFQKLLGGPVRNLVNECNGASILSGQIFDPLSTQAVNGTPCRTPFPNNTIPSGRISASSQAIMALVPHATLDALLNNTILRAGRGYSHVDAHTVKGDHYFLNKHHLSVNYVGSMTEDKNGSVLAPPVDDEGITERAWRFARVSHDVALKPNLLNELRLGYNREIFTHDPFGSRLPGWQREWGIPGFDTGSALTPGVFWGSYRRLANKQFWYATSNTYVLNEALSWTKDRHNFKFGVEYIDMWHALHKDWPVQITFGRNATAHPAALGSTGNEAASLLLGLVDNSNIPSLTGTLVDYQQRTFDAYFQDDFKITPRLTINLGVRWSLFLPLQERHDIYSAVDLAKSNPAAGGLPGSYVFAGKDGQGHRLSGGDSSANEFAPRLGLAWRLSEKFVIRAGYGISYFPTGLYGAGNNAFMTDGYDPTSTSFTSDNGVTPAFTLAQGFPANRIQDVNLTPSYSIGSNFNYWSDSAERVARMQSWNFSIQKELVPNLAWEVSYVGSKGTNLTSFHNINQLDPRYLSLGSGLLNSNISSPAGVGAGFREPWAGFASALGGNATLAQSLRPYPQYLSGFGYTSDNTGNSTYHALQTKLEKRMSQGLYLLGAYTWNKSITDSGATIYYAGNPTGSAQARDQYNRRLDKGVSPAWQPHVLSIATIYELPFGPGKQFLNRGGVAGRIVGGWRLSATLRYTSGSLISVTTPQNLPLFAGPNYATTVAGVQQLGDWSGSFDPASDRYLNADAFELPAAGTFGTGSQYLPNLRAFGQYNENVTLSKATTIKEAVKLDLRFEVFNLFNRVTFGNPSADISNRSSFGRITSQANLPRQAQVAQKLIF